MVIRAAVPADANVLTALAHRAKSSWPYPASWIAEWRPDLTLTPDYLASHFGFVSMLDGRPVGVCVLEEKPAGWSLEHFWIEPSVQRRGIGKRLLSHALAWAAERGGGSVEVISDPHAEPFYLRQGAHRVGTHPAPMPGAADRVLPVVRFDFPAQLGRQASNLQPPG